MLLAYRYWANLQSAVFTEVVSAATVRVASLHALAPAVSIHNDLPRLAVAASHVPLAHLQFTRLALLE
jgi:hypothetical protein